MKPPKNQSGRNPNRQPGQRQVAVAPVPPRVLPRALPPPPRIARPPALGGGPRPAGQTNVAQRNRSFKPPIAQLKQNSKPPIAPPVYRPQPVKSLAKTLPTAPKVNAVRGGAVQCKGPAQSASKHAAAPAAGRPRMVIQMHGPGYNLDKYKEASNSHFDRHLDTWRQHGVNSKEEVRKIAMQLFELSRQDEWKNKGGNWSIDHKWGGQTVRLVWSTAADNVGITTCYILEPRGGGQQQQPQPAQPAQPAQQQQQPQFSPQQQQQMYQQYYQQQQQWAQQQQQQWGQQQQQQWPQQVYAPQYQQYYQQQQQPSAASAASSSAPAQVPASPQMRDVQKNGYTWRLVNDVPTYWFDPRSNSWRNRYEPTASGAYFDWWSA